MIDTKKIKIGLLVQKLRAYEKERVLSSAIDKMSTTLLFRGSKK